MECRFIEEWYELSYYAYRCCPIIYVKRNDNNTPYLHYKYLKLWGAKFGVQNLNFEKHAFFKSIYT